MKFLLLSSFFASAAAQPWTWQPGNFDQGIVVDECSIRNDPACSSERRLRLSNGLKARPIAIKPDKDVLEDGGPPAVEALGFPEVVAGKGFLHPDNDGAGLFPKPGGNGYLYASNSEDKPNGGVWVIETDNDHNAVDYYPILQGTKDNCAGGSTPWGSWVSCEEEHPTGYCYQTDPEGILPAEVTEVTAYGGNWEAFAWNDKEFPPRGYTTDDDYPDPGPIGDGDDECDNKVCFDGREMPADYAGYCGALDRYTPSDDYIDEYFQGGNTLSKAERWQILNDPNAKHNFLKLNPDAGTFEWVEDPCDANPELYPKGEGIHIENNILTFVGKENQEIFYLNLKTMRYENYPIFKEPDNIRGLGRDMYICTDDDEPNMVILIDTKTQCSSIIMQEDCDGEPCDTGYGGTEFAGLDFSPDKKAFYVALQDRAIWVVEREDGLAFDKKTLSRICV